jgi:hypothetical protein
MEDTMQVLRENSPTRRNIFFALEGESLSDLELAQALQVNEHVRELRINTRGMWDCSWDSLLRVIVTREILHQIGIGDYDDDDDPHFVMTRTHKFLQAIQMNSAIQTVILLKVRVSSTSIASFLDAASSITTFFGRSQHGSA